MVFFCGQEIHEEVVEEDSEDGMTKGPHLGRAGI